MNRSPYHKSSGLAMMDITELQQTCFFAIAIPSISN
jgi:hypothetical protein